MVDPFHQSLRGTKDQGGVNWCGSFHIVISFFPLVFDPCLWAPFKEGPSPLGGIREGMQCLMHLSLTVTTCCTGLHVTHSDNHSTFGSDLKESSFVFAIRAT